MSNKKQGFTLPPNNPFLIQNSSYPCIHFDPAQTDAIRLPAWTGDSTLEPAQVSWLPGVSTIGASHLPYSDGEQAIFFSGGNRIGKIRFTDGSFTLIDEILIPGYEGASISTTELREIEKQMRAAGKDEEKSLALLTDFLRKTEQNTATLMNGAYTVMDKDGNHYAGWGTTIYKAADVRPGHEHKIFP